MSFQHHIFSCKWRRSPSKKEEDLWCKIGWWKKEVISLVLNMLYYNVPILSYLPRLCRYGAVFVSSWEPLEPAEIEVCVGSFHHNVFINSVFIVVQRSISLHSLPRLYIHMDMHFIRGIRAQDQPECYAPGAVVGVQSLAQGHLVVDDSIIDAMSSSCKLHPSVTDKDQASYP